MKLRLVFLVRFPLLVAIAFCFGCMNLGNSVSRKAIIEDRVHESKVFQEERHYRIFLPPDYYSKTDKRYPVIYFFHGFGGRFNGPADGESSVSAEARYYDEFNGNVKRCGPDSLDNIAEFVRNNDVIVAKWDGYVKEQYPRPYDIGPVQLDIQFTEYFKEFINIVDRNYRTIAKREGRAVSGLSMGGFTSMNMAAKFPHLISSASFFCPSGGFSIGPKELQVFTPMKDMKINYVGLPIRMHIGKNDFLRQYHYAIDKAFKKYDLAYESWQYGSSYFNGFHNVVNVKGQFDFHMKNFRNPTARPEKWHHINVFPNFDVWGYTIKSDREVPGFVILEDIQKEGFKISSRKWLPDGSPIANQTIHILTDSLYEIGKNYQVVRTQSPYSKIVEQTVEANEQGRINITCDGTPTDIGIYQKEDPGLLSMSGFKMSDDMPEFGKELEIAPILFNKGGQDLSNIRVELISNDANVKVLSVPDTIEYISKTSIFTKSKFKIIALDPNVRSVVLKLKLKYNQNSEIFRLEVPFYNSDFELKSFSIADGNYFQQEASSTEDSFFGKGNGNGIIEAGEKISFLTQVDNNPNWYGLKVYTDDPFVDSDKEEMKFNNRNDWSGAMRSTSEIYIKPTCPDGHVINFYGEYDYPAIGDIRRDNQAATSFIKYKKRVSFKVKVKNQKTN